MLYIARMLAVGFISIAACAEAPALDLVGADGLFYTTRRRTQERTGYLTFALTPVLHSDELQAVIDDLKAMDPLARFGIPSPTASTFYIVGPAFDRRQLTAV